MQQHESPSANVGRDRAAKPARAPRFDRLQRRANGHDVRAQLSSNAQFKRAMIAQRKGAGAGEPGAVLDAAASGVQGSGSALPFLEVIQRSFGHHDVSRVQAFVGGQAKTASDAIGAEAYATGNHVAFRAAPTLHTAAHEAAHVVQQRAGVQLSGGVGQVGDRYETHADAVADRVVRGESAVQLLDQFTGGGGAGAAVQKRDAGVDDAPELDAGVGPTSYADGCVAEMGGSREYRAAGFASVAEIEAYQAECATLVEGELAGELGAHTIVRIVDGAAEVAISVAQLGGEVTGMAADAVDGALRGAKRVGKVTWLFAQAQKSPNPRERMAASAELADMGEVDDELVSFFAGLLGAGLKLQIWANSPEGPLAHIIKSVCGGYVEEELLKYGARNVDSIADAATGVSDAIAKFGIKKVLSMKMSGPVVATAIRTTLWAVASAISAGSAGTLAAAARSGFGKYGVMAVGMALAGLGIAEEVTQPRQRLKASHPELFQFATAHNCAFMWTWIEPHLPALKAAIADALPTGSDHD